MKNTKYIMSCGLAFYEEVEMNVLAYYAKKGWLLEDTVLGGFLYKLKKDKPQSLQYSLDYQQNADEEYFKMFSEAGWNKVVSKRNFLHIFSAPIGTTPIYINGEAESEKYIKMKNLTKISTIYSLVATIISFLLLLLSNNILNTFNPIFKILFIISVSIFTLFLTAYISYNYRSQNIGMPKNRNEKFAMKFLFWTLYFIVLIIMYINNFYGTILLLSLLALQSIYMTHRKK